MKRWLLKISAVTLVCVALLCLGTARPAKVVAAPLDGAVATGDQAPAPSARPPELGTGRLRFEVEPDDVEIYLDERYLGKASELRGREVEGILAGSRLVTLQWSGERTFLEVVVPVGGTRTIRVDLAPPRAVSPVQVPFSPLETKERAPMPTFSGPAPSATSGLGPLPPNVSSEYLETKGTGWTPSFDEKKGKVVARIWIVISPKPDLPTGAYLEVRFDNPADPNVPIVVDLPRGAQQGANPFEVYLGTKLGDFNDPNSPFISGNARDGEKAISVFSPETQGLKCKNYKIVVNVYRDSSKAQLLGVHEQFNQSVVDADMVNSLTELLEAYIHPGRYCQFKNQ